MKAPTLFIEDGTKVDIWFLKKLKGIQVLIQEMLQIETIFCDVCGEIYPDSGFYHSGSCEPHIICGNICNDCDKELYPANG